jgi:enoyl-CoA hydratase/carnithine racemase
VDYQHLLLARQGAAETVTLNRPEQLNALNDRLIDELHDYFTLLPQRREVRVVVLRGTGRSFCAGLDLKEAPIEEMQRSVHFGLARQRVLRNLVVAMRRCPQPIVCIVQGAASGGGFGLALASDIRLCTPDTRMNAAFIRVGLSACDMGVSYFLPRMIGSSAAATYLLTGRFIDAARALQLGLVSMVAEMAQIEAEAESLVQDMLRATPLGLDLTKEALAHNIDAGSLDAALAMEDRNQILCTQGEDFLEGARAFIAKRLPLYAAPAVPAADA